MMPLAYKTSFITLENSGEKKFGLLLYEVAILSVLVFT